MSDEAVRKMLSQEAVEAEMVAQAQELLYAASKLPIVDGEKPKICPACGQLSWEELSRVPTNEAG